LQIKNAWKNETQLINDQFKTSSCLEISKLEIKFDLTGGGKTGPL